MTIAVDLGRKATKQTKKTYHFWFTLTLISDLVCRIFVSRTSLLLFEVGIPNLACESILEWRIVPFHFPVTVTLTNDLVSRIGIESGA